MKLALLEQSTVQLSFVFYIYLRITYVCSTRAVAVSTIFTFAWNPNHVQLENAIVCDAFFPYFLLTIFLFLLHDAITIVSSNASDLVCC